MQSKFVQAGPVRLQYFESVPGLAPPETVVLVHGYASNAPIWRYTFEQLADRGGFRVIAINNRGAGDSDRTELESDYRVESFAVDLYNAVSALELSGFTLVGHSMGGATVTQFCPGPSRPAQGAGIAELGPAERPPVGARLGGTTPRVGSQRRRNGR